MGSISLTFQGSTMDEISELVAAWLWDSRHQGADVPAAKSAAVTRLLAGVHGVKSRQLLRALAEAGVRGEAVMLTPSLMVDFGVASGTAFAGMIGPVNRRARSTLGRDLIREVSTDRQTRVWRIAAADAQAVLEGLEQ